MQIQENINYVLIGSQESMMREIFEPKKSPFYHFGTVMTLGKIPYDDFSSYIETRLPHSKKVDIHVLVSEILPFTACHPYYTQKLAFHFWNLLNEGKEDNDLVERAIAESNDIHDMDYERLWMSLNKTDRKVMCFMCDNTQSPLKSLKIGLPTSTIFSSLKRLLRSGFVIRNENYQIDDPFFSRWIKKRIVD